MWKKVRWKNWQSLRIRSSSDHPGESISARTSPENAAGRGRHPSLCLLFGPAESARLKALASHSDGFRLAEIDLELRGEGELTGTRQSGLARFRFARLPDDAELLERAHGAALDLLAADPELAEPEHVLLAERLALVEAEPVAA